MMNIENKPSALNSELGYSRRMTSMESEKEVRPSGTSLPVVQPSGTSPPGFDDLPEELAELKISETIAKGTPPGPGKDEAWKQVKVRSFDKPRYPKPEKSRTYFVKTNVIMIDPVKFWFFDMELLKNPETLNDFNDFLSKIASETKELTDVFTDVSKEITVYNARIQHFKFNEISISKENAFDELSKFFSSSIEVEIKCYDNYKRILFRFLDETIQNIYYKYNCFSAYTRN